ncbi:efflux transporter periplasmic adaptor subunit [Longibacter salinarum]|uniref:Efflux transporter periplasmic adaptor subunit n=1 Tax=Longibacter salinarum TaxID=1850348 RepID=A0A2A8CUB3_9BACT|nr:efflux RND transporter periplasmic adaptor subunit [Longibacter salinarum]PEN11083.1 efflux transporter periplasmic adaptor subunit [Longibacter salinarum]
MATSSSSRTRRILYIVGGLLVVGLAAGVTAWSTGFLGNGEEGRPVEVAEAEHRTITQVVTAFGRAQPETEVTISPDVSGEIVELTVREGDQVKKGQLLTRLRPDNYVAEVERARAEVSQARATLSERRADSLQARQQFERQEKLYDKGVVSDADFETAQSTYHQSVARLEAARYQVESAEARLQDSREQLEKTRIYAPMDGTVSKLNVEAGERVVGTSQMQGTEIMNIARLDQMELEVDVNENDVVNVALQDTAAIEIDAYPDRRFRGAVTEIANSARVSGEGTQDQVTNFPVKVRVLDAHNVDAGQVASNGSGVTRQEVPTGPDAPPNLRPGMSGTVDIFTQTMADVVSVPIQAVTVRDFNALDGGSDEPEGLDRKEDLRRVVFVAEADTARMVEVETSISDDTHVAVVAGLEGGENVIIGPYSAVSRELSEGDRVRIRDKSEDGSSMEIASND